MSDNFELNKVYKFFAEGFEHPVVGKLIDYKPSHENRLVLVVRTDDNEIINIFISAVSAWSIIPKVAA